jgi:hypothetical protein
MLKYTVVVAGSIEDLERSVHEMISEGFRPIGGVAVDKNRDLLQALIKEEEHEAISIPQVTI